MLYAILCYDREAVTEGLSPDEDAAVMERLVAVQEPMARQGKLGPVARLMPTTAATTLRKGGEPLVIDGPFAETKEQLLGFYIVECDEPGGGGRDRARAGATPTPARRLRDPPASACSSAGDAARHDRHRLDRRGADLGAARRRSARCCAISATSTRPRRRFRRPACAR